jgi:hypothetical protein
MAQEGLPDTRRALNDDADPVGAPRSAVSTTGLVHRPLGSRAIGGL